MIPIQLENVTRPEFTGYIVVDELPLNVQLLVPSGFDTIEISGEFKIRFTDDNIAVTVSGLHMYIDGTDFKQELDEYEVDFASLASDIEEKLDVSEIYEEIASQWESEY